MNFKGHSERVSNFRNGSKRKMCKVIYSWRLRSRSWLEIRASRSNLSKQSSVTNGICPDGCQVKGADEAFCLPCSTWNPKARGFSTFPSSWSRGHGDVFWLMLVEIANCLSPLELLKPNATNQVTYKQLLFFFCSQFWRLGESPSAALAGSCSGEVPLLVAVCTLLTVSSRDGKG